MSGFLLRIRDFKGVVRDAGPAALEPTQFYVDEGGDHFERGTWKLRRGMLRTPVPPLFGAVTAMGAGEVIDGDISYCFVDATGTFHGYPQLYGGQAIVGGTATPAVAPQKPRPIWRVGGTQRPL